MFTAFYNPQHPTPNSSHFPKKQQADIKNDVLFQNVLLFYVACLLIMCELQPVDSGCVCVCDKCVVCASVCVYSPVATPFQSEKKNTLHLKLCE